MRCSVPEQDREAVLNLWAEGATLIEIVATTGVRRGAAGMIVARARKRGDTRATSRYGYFATARPLDGEILNRYAEGVTIPAIAAEFGISVHAAKWAIQRARLRGDDRAARRRPQPEIPVPAWVPSDLRAGYLEIAGIDGEEAAASWARREKAKAARAVA